MKKETERKKGRKPDAEDKKMYFHMANSKVIQLRMNTDGITLLQIMMNDEGWDNTSAFIRYKLFGIELHRKINELIKRKNPDELAILLRNEIMNLADNFIYFRYRYEKDMNQLWKEEGVDLKEWISATNHWHHQVAERIKEVLNLCRKIADEIGLEEYFNLPSDNMNIDTNNATKEELDALAEQLRRERIAMGRIEEL